MPINSQHPDYKKMAPKWKRCEDVSNGQDAVHAATDAYLPRLKDQSDADYNAYKLRAGFYNATWRTISGLIGMVMRKPPLVVVPSTIEPYLKDITLSGIPLNAFAQTILEDALEKGRVGILVDCPSLVIPNATLADSLANNIRPTMQYYAAESIINWKTGRVNNATVLTMVVLEEEEEVAVDEYSSKSEKRWRELTLVEGVYRVRMFKRVGEDNGSQVDQQIGDDMFPTMDGAALDYIPFIFIGLDDLTPEVDEPPLIDLVDMNLAHYRVSADYEHGCHFTGLPTAVVSGYVRTDMTEKLYIGSSSAWVFPDPAAKATFLEFHGDGLKTLEGNLARKEQQMAVLGARMLEPMKRGVESADTASIHRKGEESMLSAAAQTVSTGIEIALRWVAQWAGQNPDAATFDLNHDFYPAPIDPQMLTAMLSAWQMGAPGFSDQGLYEKLQAGEMADADTTLEEEQARIANRQIEIANQQAAFSTPAVPGDTKVAP